MSLWFGLAFICGCFYLGLYEKDLKGKAPGYLVKILKTQSNLRIFYLVIALVASASVAKSFSEIWWFLLIVIGGSFFSVVLPELSGSRKNLEKYAKNAKRKTNTDENP